MKTNLFKFAPLLLFSLVVLYASCSKENTFKLAEVTKNCTGTYIKTEGITYMVCNEQILKQNKEGDIIEVKMKLIDSEECNRDRYNQVGCFKHFIYNGQIDIIKVK